MTNTETERIIDTHASAAEKGASEAPFSQRANISLAIRIESSLSSIPDGGRILGIGIRGKNGSVTESKHAEELSRRGITIEHIDTTEQIAMMREAPEEAVDVIVGNVFGGDTIPQALREIKKALKPEGVIHLNVHKGPRQNGDFDDMSYIEDQITTAGMYARTTDKKERGQWWEVDATIPPIVTAYSRSGAWEMIDTTEDEDLYSKRAHSAPIKIFSA